VNRGHAFASEEVPLPSVGVKVSVGDGVGSLVGVEVLLSVLVGVEVLLSVPKQPPRPAILNPPRTFKAPRLDQRSSDTVDHRTDIN